jgi:crotonobetainyl-CoA:carnitine CoA-transferase CaiB-like acyl-CoA transferase
MFASANRNKRAITLDFSKDAGRDLALRLAARCDVVVESFIGGVMARRGLGYADIRALNPSVIYCSVTGYGQAGPDSARPGFDGIFQAKSGMMSVSGPETGAPGDGPTKTGPSLVDVATGYHAVIGVLTALFHRERTGEGQCIDIALLDAAIAMQSHMVHDYLMSGEQPPKLGNTGNGSHPSTTFECADGHIYISAGPKHYEALCDVLGHPELKVDARFATSALRFQNRRAWSEAVREGMLTWRKAELEAALAAAGVPAAAVNTYAETFDDPHVRHRGAEIRMESREVEGGVLRLVANPVRLEKTPPLYRTPPPRFGEHTDDVLRDVLGLGDDEIQRLRDGGVI